MGHVFLKLVCQILFIFVIKDIHGLFYTKIGIRNGVWHAKILKNKKWKSNLKKMKKESYIIIWLNSNNCLRRLEKELEVRIFKGTSSIMKTNLNIKKNLFKNKLKNKARNIFKCTIFNQKTCKFPFERFTKF